MRLGDATGGWPEAAPFDAIIVTAGGPSVPETLRPPLAIGGRLVMPVGDAHRQRLVKITRRSESEYEEEELGDRWSHYSEATLPRQFDAYVWFDETRAVTPLPTRQIEGEEET